MTINVTISHDQPHSEHSFRVIAVVNGTEEPCVNIHPGQKGEFSINSGKTLRIEEIGRTDGSDKIEPQDLSAIAAFDNGGVPILPGELAKDIQTAMDQDADADGGFAVTGLVGDLNVIQETSGESAAPAAQQEVPQEPVPATTDEAIPADVEATPKKKGK